MSKISLWSASAFYLSKDEILSPISSLPHCPDFKWPCKRIPFENVVGKEENAGYQHFLLFMQCFLPISQRVSVFELHLFCRLQMLEIWTSPKKKKMVFPKGLTHSHTMTPFDAHGKQAF